MIVVNMDDGMNFGAALAALKDGKRVTRKGWNGEGMWVEMIDPNRYSPLKRRYLAMSPVDGEMVPWTASSTDLLAEDWIEVPEE